MAPLPGQVTTLQSQVASLQAQNASLLGRLNTLQAFTLAGFPDPSLGPKGDVKSSLVEGTVYGVTTDSSARILVVGPATSGEMYVARFTNGSLDATFGTNGIVLGGHSPSSGSAVLVDAMSRVLVVGSSTSSLDLWRFDASGNPDAAFGTAGFASVAGASVTPASVALDAGGRIFVSGSSGSPAHVTVWCFTSAGAPDTTFNGTGNLVDPTGTFGVGVAIDSGGNVVVSGGTATNNMGVWRYTAAGAVDATFNGTGRYIDALAATPSFASGVAIDGTGRIIAAGSSGSAMATWRLKATGAIDATFGAGGLVTSVGIGAFADAVGVAVDAAGRILVGGQSFSGFPTVWRISAQGQLDPSFGAGTGFAVNQDLFVNAAQPAFTVDPLGRPVIVGGVNVVGGEAVGLYRFD